MNIPGGDLFLHAENVGLDLKHPKFLFSIKLGVILANVFEIN